MHWLRGDSVNADKVGTLSSRPITVLVVHVVSTGSYIMEGDCLRLRHKLQNTELQNKNI